MSPEQLKLHARPASVQVGEGRLGDALAREVARRERAAFEAGRRAGRVEALAKAVTGLDDAAQAFATAARKSDEALASDSVELALAIAAELVRCEVAARRHGIEKIVRETLHASGVGRGACTVHVAPEDAQTLATLSFRAGTKIEADQDVPPCCVQVETPQGLIVRDIDAAMTSVAARLREEARA
ncbi:MAG TPA: FliH/SctL family protein [Planctomycetota bacterium]|nr:FliH/SctL family protein [Planctomycetota bacterium]